MSKIKILRIITRLNIGGPAIHTVLLNSRFETEKFTSTLVAGSVGKHETDMMYLAKKYNVNPIYIQELVRPIKPLKDLISLYKIFKVMLRVKPDIVHTHTAKAGTIGRLAAILAGVKIRVHTFHGNIFKGYFGKFKTKIFKVIEKFLARISTKIIAISKKQKEDLINYSIAEDEKIEIVFLGFDFNNVLPSKNHLGQFRKKFSLSEDVKLIGIIGRLVPIKNHKLFINIAEQLLSKYDNLIFLIIGDGVLREELEKEIKGKNLEEKIKITGFIKDLKPVYADLDLVLLTSNNEGTPVAIIEAMVCKKIVMATNVGGIEDFIINNVNGFYFDHNSSDFVHEIENWINNKRDYVSIKNKAAESAEKLFSAKRLIKDLKVLYSNIINLKI